MSARFLSARTLIKLVHAAWSFDERESVALPKELLGNPTASTFLNKRNGIAHGPSSGTRNASTRRSGRIGH